MGKCQLPAAILTSGTPERGGGKGVFPNISQIGIFVYAAPEGKVFERFWSEKKARTLPISVWNRVWFSRELRVCMKVFTVSIPFLRTLWTLCQAKTAKRGKATREDFIA